MVATNVGRKSWRLDFRNGLNASNNLHLISIFQFNLFRGLPFSTTVNQF